MTYELHPLCTLFPRITGSEFEALCDDIVAHGLREPIVVFDGMVLDGGNRYRACLERQVTPEFVPYDGPDAVAFVLSANLHRRHLSPGQHAAIVSSCVNWAEAQPRGGDRKSDQSATLHFDSAADRAKVSGASLRTQKMADKVAKADPGLARDVAQGTVSLPKAVEQVDRRQSDRRRAPTEKQVEAERIADEAHGDFDPLAELEEASRTIDRLTAELNVAGADDLKAEALKWRRLYDVSRGEQSKYMDLCDKAKKREEWNARQLARCGKAVGQDDPDKIAPAVEAFVRKHKQAEAV